ncbi:MAG: phospholipase [Ruminococcaceae bacterium]|nr:phospholipase [Oscillospiraceae bacterium]
MEILKHKELDYVIRYPENFHKTERYPLLIYLHGAGGRGRNIEIIRNHGFFNHSESFCTNAVTVAPQCYADSWFDIFEQLQEFLESLIASDYIDDSRVYLMGASMGGYGTWQMAMSRPELFAAIVPICGGGMYWNAERLKSIAVWAFHGSDDSTVLCEESKKMVNKAQSKGCNAKLTIFEGVGHNAWDPTWKCEEMWHWLFDQRKQCQEEIKNEYSDVIKFG